MEGIKGVQGVSGYFILLFVMAVPSPTLLPLPLPAPALDGKALFSPLPGAAEMVSFHLDRWRVSARKDEGNSCWFGAEGGRQRRGRKLTQSLTTHNNKKENLTTQCAPRKRSQTPEVFAPSPVAPAGMTRAFRKHRGERIATLLG